MVCTFGTATSRADLALKHFIKAEYKYEEHMLEPLCDLPGMKNLASKAHESTKVLHFRPEQLIERFAIEMELWAEDVVQGHIPAF